METRETGDYYVRHGEKSKFASYTGTVRSNHLSLFSCSGSCAFVLVFVVFLFLCILFGLSRVFVLGAFVLVLVLFVSLFVFLICVLNFVLSCALSCSLSCIPICVLGFVLAGVIFIALVLISVVAVVFAVGHVPRRVLVLAYFLRSSCSELCLCSLS